MLDLNELKQLILFSEMNTLTDVAQACHISTPSVTRSMKHLEETFEVSLFIRGKNRIELNETGMAAVEAARSILAEHDKQLQIVRDFDRSRKTITVLSCAPAPLWDLLPRLSSQNPDKIVSSQLAEPEAIISAYENGTCTYAILPFPYKDFVPCLTEQLYISVKKGHDLAGRKTISFQEINGFNFLLRSEIGFWDKLCRQKMPASRFLLQTDDFEFWELARTSSLPCFSTDISAKRGLSPEDRLLIPISDKAATVTFYVNRRFM